MVKKVVAVLVSSVALTTVAPGAKPGIWPLNVKAPITSVNTCVGKVKAGPVPIETLMPQ